MAKKSTDPNDPKKQNRRMTFATRLSDKLIDRNLRLSRAATTKVPDHERGSKSKEEVSAWFGDRRESNVVKPIVSGCRSCT